jgi:4-hydroxy-3-methylbut-2-enyl diphosphate reductase
MRETAETAFTSFEDQPRIAGEHGKRREKLGISHSVESNAKCLFLSLLSFMHLREDLMDLLLANPRGFCAGVDRAIEIVERALALHGAPIYVRRDVVHNKFVVENLRQKGAVFIEDMTGVPRGSFLIFSAHGVSQSVRQEAEARGLVVFDATCPLVTKIHITVARSRAQGKEIIMIGHAGHPEVEGTMGQAANGMYLVESTDDVQHLGVKDENNLAFVTQTTLSMDDASTIIAALKARFPTITVPTKYDICYATQNRQDAVKIMTGQCDVVIVVGSSNSSNSNRLREVANNMNVPAYLVDNASELQAEWLKSKQHVGLTAGASAPEVLVQKVIARLKQLGAASVRELHGISENVIFPLPKALNIGTNTPSQDHLRI